MRKIYQGSELRYNVYQSLTGFCVFLKDARTSVQQLSLLFKFEQIHLHVSRTLSLSYLHPCHRLFDVFLAAVLLIWAVPVSNLPKVYLRLRFSILIEHLQDGVIRLSCRLLTLKGKFVHFVLKLDSDSRTGYPEIGVFFVDAVEFKVSDALSWLLLHVD